MIIVSSLMYIAGGENKDCFSTTTEMLWLVQWGFFLDSKQYHIIIIQLKRNTQSPAVYIMIH